MAATIKGGWQESNNIYGLLHNRGAFDRTLLFPTIEEEPTDVDDLDGEDIELASIKFHVINNKLYCFNPLDKAWHAIGADDTNFANTDLTLSGDRDHNLDGHMLMIHDGVAFESDHTMFIVSPNNVHARAMSADGSKDGFFQLTNDGIIGYAYGYATSVRFLWGNAGIDVQANILDLGMQQGILVAQSGDTNPYGGTKAFFSTYNKPDNAVIQLGAYGMGVGDPGSIMRATRDGFFLLGTYDEFSVDPPVMGEGMSLYQPTTDTVEGYEVILYRTEDGRFTRAATTLIGSGGGGGTSLRTYYVSPSGNDSNDGMTPATAWQTIAKVNAATLVGGDTVLFEGGKTFTDAYLVCKGGTAGNRITYGSFNGNRAIIQGNARQAADLSGSSYVTVRDLILQGINHPATPWGYDGIGMSAGYGNPTTLTDISFINLKIDGFGWSGIGTFMETNACSISNVLIEGCEISESCNGIWIREADSGTVNGNINYVIRNCKTYNNFGMTSYTDNWSGTGIVLEGGVNCLIEGCESYGNGWKNGASIGGPHGIWLADCVGCVIRNCESHHNGTGIGAAGKDGGGFDMDGGCQNCVIEYCYSHENAGCGYAMFEWGSPRPAFTGNVIRYNISVNDSRYSSMGGISVWTTEAGFTNNRIHNNLVICDGDTLVLGTMVAFEFIAGTYNTLNIVNNIFIIDGANVSLTSGTVGGTWSNNIIYALNGANLNYTTGCTTANPLLVNHTVEPITVGAYTHKGVRDALWHYQLRAISPAVNTGTSTISGYTFPTRDFWGLTTPIGNRNIGPHELVP